MIEQDVEIRTPDGTADGVLFHAEQRRQPGVIHLTDIGGIRPATRAMARRVAELGYTVLMPNVFYRTARPPVIAYPINMADERTAKRFGELAGPLTLDAMERDGSACVDFLAAQPSAADGPMAVVGHCFTGAMALRIAASRPDRIAAAASFHGGNLFTDKPTSPHLALPRVKARLYFAHASQDRTMPAEAIAGFERALAQWGGRYESETYDGAFHGWTVSDSPVYNQPAAERAFDKVRELLAALSG
ncbi:MAG: dienelactone hydrolase family protein [Betaproteobacteria bacterium]